MGKEENGVGVDECGKAEKLHEHLEAMHSAVVNHDDPGITFTVK